MFSQSGKIVAHTGYWDGNEMEHPEDDFSDALIRLSDSVLIVSGTILGFSVSFLAKENDLTSAYLLRSAWIALALAIFCHVNGRLAAVINLSPLPFIPAKIRPSLDGLRRVYVQISAGSFMVALGLLTAFGFINV